MAAPSFVLVLSFSAVVLGTLVALFAGLRPASQRLGVPLWPFGLGVVIHVLLALGLAASGVLLSPTLPPRPLVLVVLALVGWLVASRTRFGTVVAETPLVFWVGLQFFRLPLELVMHQAAVEGVMPTVLTWTGRNWDVLTGLLAPVAAWGLHRGWPRAVTWAFNLLGAGLLLNVVTVAVLASPGPLQRIDTNVPNVWITTPPFVLLPCVLVALAAISHGIIGWRLWKDARASTSTEGG